jgi:hypothetical protein
MKVKLTKLKTLYDTQYKKDIEIVEELKVIIGLQKYEKAYECYLAWCDKQEKRPSDLSSTMVFIRSMGFNPKVTFIGDKIESSITLRFLGRDLPISRLSHQSDPTYTEVITILLQDAFFCIEYPRISLNTYLEDII